MQEHRADTRNLREAGSLQAGGRQTDFNSTLQAAGRALGPASAPVGTAHSGPRLLHCVGVLRAGWAPDSLVPWHGLGRALDGPATVVRTLQ